jgi:hypothetical protein
MATQDGCLGNDADLLVRKRIGCVAHRRLDILVCESRVSIEQIGLRGTLAEFAKDQFDRDSRAANNRLTHHNIRINLDAVFSHRRTVMWFTT